MTQLSLPHAHAPGAPPAHLGRYRLGPRLGTGGMGIVDLAWTENERPVAIKRLIPRLAAKPSFRQMFRNEAAVCARLSHPNIPRFVEFSEYDGELVLVTEFVRGLSCRRLLRDSIENRRSPSPAVALCIADQVLAALACVHGARDEHGRPLGLVHRDVSPGNVLVSRDGIIKLIDFGITRCSLLGEEPHPGELKGKPGYMSPEQILGDAVEASSDLFSLGAVLAELLTAHPVFLGPDEVETLVRMYEADVEQFTSRASHVPAPVVALVRRALSRFPEDRFGSAEEFRRGIAEAATRSGLNPSRETLVEWLDGPEAQTPKSGVFAAPWGRSLAPRSTSPRRPVSRSSFGAAAQRRGHALPSESSPLRLRASTRSAGAPVVHSLRTDEILQWVATGRAGEGDEIAVGDAWVTLSEHDRLGPRVTREASRSRGRAERPCWTVAVDGTRHVAALARACEQRATGLLQAHDGPFALGLFLRDGAPVFASSTEPDDLLGARLVRGGLVTADALRKALAISFDQGCLLGRALMLSGAIRASVLFRALVDQLGARVAAFTSLRAGTASFYSGIGPGVSVPSLAIPFRSLVEYLRLTSTSCAPDRKAAP